MLRWRTVLAAAAALRLSQSHWDTAGRVDEVSGLIKRSRRSHAAKRYRISIAAPLSSSAPCWRPPRPSRSTRSALPGGYLRDPLRPDVLLQVAPWIAAHRAHLDVTTEQIPAKGITDQVNSDSFVLVVACARRQSPRLLTISLMAAPEMRSVSLPRPSSCSLRCARPPDAFDRAR